MAKSHSLKKWWIPLLALAVALSCSMPERTGSSAKDSESPPQTSGDAGLQETKFALGVQETSIAMQQTSQAISNQQQAAQAATEAANLVLAQTGTAAAVPPTVTVTATVAVPPAAEATTPEVLPPTQEVVSAPAEVLPPSGSTVGKEDMSALIKAANVLVYEDMAGSIDRYRLIMKAVNNMDFSGGRVVDVADRAGDFKTELVGTADWDLIIAGVEGRSVVQGEFWEYVQRHIDKKVAVIIENWNLDEHYTDIRPIFSDCGIGFEKDWWRPNNFSILDNAIYILEPDHEFFKSVPNPDVSLGNPNFLYWIPPRTNDGGDYMQIASGGDAIFLAGTATYNKSKHGVVATCMEGRLIVQTFSTHDYKETEVVKLWEDYIVWTLTNHFKAIQ